MKISSSPNDNKERFVNVVRAFAEGKKCQLAVLEVRQTALKYMPTLESFLLPFVDQEIRPSWVFQQDRASIHRAPVFKEWFNEEDMVLLDRPAKVSGLEPYGKPMGVLARKFYETHRQFKGLAELRECILACWDSISEHTLHNLVGSILRRCFEVVKGNWKAKKYQIPQGA